MVLITLYTRLWAERRLAPTICLGSPRDNIDVNCPEKTVLNRPCGFQVSSATFRMSLFVVSDTPGEAVKLALRLNPNQREQ